MNQFITDVLRVLGAESGLALIAKATCLLVVAFVALKAATDARAATRHAIVACTFAALLALPAVLWLSPGFTIRVRQESRQLAQVVSPSSTTEGALPAVNANAPEKNATSFSGGEGVTPHVPLFTAEHVAGLWLIGALLSFAPFAFGMFQMRRLRRSSLPWSGDRAFIEQLMRHAGLRRPVELLTHEHISTPLMSGVLSPAVMLPGSADAWSNHELRRALTHELEHVRRGDWLIHVLARVVCALYWFHPLVWTAWRRLTLEAERACDDAVLQNADRSEYAEQLVSLARQISGSTPQPMIAMAARSDLSTRISAVLDATQARGRLRSLPAVAAVMVTAVLTTAMTPVRVVATTVVATPVAAKSNPRVRVDSIAVTTPNTEPRKASSAVTNPKVEVSSDSVEVSAASVAPAPTTSSFTAQRLRPHVDCSSSLLRAAERGNLESLAALIAKGAEVNCTEDGDGTPLIMAARRGRKEAVQLLLTNGADPNLSSSGDGSPLIMAAENGHIDVVQLLLANHADPNLGVPGDGNALIKAAGAGELEIAQMLLDNGARIEDVVAGDENPLIHASEFGRLEMTKFLIARGANVNARVWVGPTDSRGVGEWRTPLSMAQRGGHEAVVALLRSAGAR